ncbi:MAG: hypothetical protein K2Q09_08020, partial [Phycisphaerales bacterium]|nr:hypothetical protein [Phycisphaerales bacterium]
MTPLRGGRLTAGNAEELEVAASKATFGRMFAWSAATVVLAGLPPQLIGEEPRSERDVTYATRNVDGMNDPDGLRMNVVVPVGVKEGERRACVVCVHGGGWSGGHREDL